MKRRGGIIPAQKKWGSRGGGGMGSSGRSRLLVGLLLVWWWFLLLGYCGCQQEEGPPSSFPVSSFSLPQMKLAPYDWKYMRVELPPWFSSMIMRFMSNVNIDSDTMKRFLKDMMPIICFRHGGPPLPDVSDTSLKNLSLNFTFNGPLERAQNLQSVDWCLPFQKNITVTLTNEQISPGVWYIGFFNGLGPARTQSRMITRGHTYLFSTTLSIEGCSTSTIWGPSCNETISPLFCSPSEFYRHSRGLSDAVVYSAVGKMNHFPISGDPIVTPYHLPETPHVASSKRTILSYKERKEASDPGQLKRYEMFVLCNDSLAVPCLVDGNMNFYSLDIMDPTSELEIVADKVRLTDETSVNITMDSGSILLMCYARYNALPLSTLYDFSADISHTSFVLQFPKIGRWYIAVHAVNRMKINGEIQGTNFNAKLCFSLRWELRACPLGKAGLNCAWNLQSLQRIYWKDSYFPFRSCYLPVGESSKLTKFPLEPLLSNSTVDDKLDIAWTYFLLDIPHGAAGANLHVQLASDTIMEYEIYAKFGGIPSTDNWDYYANKTSSDNGSMMLMSNGSDKAIDIYLLYVREGSWGFGIKHVPHSPYKLQTMMSIALEACPNSCSSHGNCRSYLDETGSFYSFCYCDRDHGGFDCSNELVSPQGHIQQSIFLIASNAAAILPAFWALRQKAFAEWVLFTSSGISSGLYHACDVGTWCPLSFHVLQFMDFWLSFMAVVSTFVFMATISESSKRAIHTCVSIITALLAATGATRSANITLVIAIGTSGLLIGWILEFSSARRTIISFLPGCCNLNVNERWQTSRAWFLNIVKILHKRFCWFFLLMGFIALAAAGTSWKLEASQNYWIWHSLWHITIYTSSFFFLFSVRSNRQGYRATESELTQRNSPRLQSTETQSSSY